MRLSRSFDVEQSPSVAARIAAADETLPRLFPDARTEIIERSGDRRTTQTHYTALGREGVATFHFDVAGDGSIRFEKICDGNVWRQLEGVVTFVQRGTGTRVSLEMQGRTKTLVPELAIRGPMKDQIEQMSDALRDCIEQGGD
jgi:predicted HTH transcriptional regulator